MITTPQPPEILQIQKNPLAKRMLPKLGLGAAWIGKEEEALVLEALRRKELFRYYGRDPKNPPSMAATLEREFREMVGTKFALAVSSGTAALEVALGALGIGPGDEVIIPVWSWISCWTSVVRLGALPVLAEIDESFCLTPGEITRLRTPNTKAVMVVHYQGIAADMAPIMEEAKFAGIRVIEDCAESAGVLYHGKRVGSIGDIGTFSFQYQKSMTSGEGGMVTMNDPLLYERAVRMHDLGQLRAYHTQFIKPQVPAFAGGQFRMTELQAAVALAQLRKLDQIRAHCRRLQSRVLLKTRTLPHLQFRLIPDPKGDTGFEIYWLFKNPEQSKEFFDRLTQWNVGCAKTSGTTCHYTQNYCRQRQTYAASASPFAKFTQWPAHGYRAEDFPKTESIVHSYVAIPMGVLFADEDADYIGEAIAHVYEEMFGSRSDS